MASALNSLAVAEIGRKRRVSSSQQTIEATQHKAATVAIWFVPWTNRRVGGQGATASVASPNAFVQICALDERRSKARHPSAHNMAGQLPL